MPQPVPFTSTDVTGLHDCLHTIVRDGGSPGGVIVCGTASGSRQVLASGILGAECGASPAGERSVYDIASLTKVVATWPLTGQALAAGLIGLDAPIRDFLPAFTGEAPSGHATVRQLLTHTSGLRAATRLDQYRNATAPLHELICREPLGEQPGTHRYINRGFILLGLALTHVHSAPLHELAGKLWAETGMTGTVYGPVSRTCQAAPTEQLLQGAPRIWGGPHDTNAGLMGGVAGHAGVFSTPADLATYAEHLLTASDGGSWLGTWLRDSLTPQAPIAPGAERGLAWVLTAGGQTAGHHGFTGTSLFLAPALGRYIVICTNAIYYGPSRDRLRPLRDTALKVITA